MLIEQEVPLLLRIGFLIVMVPVIALVFSLKIKFRKHGYDWILSHLILFSLGALFWIRILETRAFTSSAYNSLSIASIGIIWGLSMMCLTVGLLDLSNLKKEQTE